jgi:hypothetical protein
MSPTSRPYFVRLTLPLVLACSASSGSDATSDVPLTSPTAGSHLDPSWHEHIAPIVTARCVTCHRAGGIAPFALDSYRAAAPFAARMAAAVERGTMPPFLARETEECTPRHRYANDVRLSAEQIEQLRAWADHGAPEGDPAHAAPLAPPQESALPRADVSLSLPGPVVIPANTTADLHTCAVVDPKLARDVYVVGRHIEAGNPRVLHHVVYYMLKPERADATRTPVSRAEMLETLRATKGVAPGDRYDCFGGPALDTTGLASELLGSWAPGGAPALSPYDSGQPLAKDALVVMDLHYHPTGESELDDSTTLTLMFAERRPPFIAQPVLLGNFQGRTEHPAGVGELVRQPDEATAKFEIPAGASRHVEEMTWTWKLPNAPHGVRAYYAGTHMHYVGRDMSVQLENTQPEPGELPQECLVHTPAWDFNWQGGYGYVARYDELPLMNPGDVVRMRCIYDNTLANGFLSRALSARGKNAPERVELGEDTLDEMCLAALGIVYPNPLP